MVSFGAEVPFSLRARCCFSTESRCDAAFALEALDHRPHSPRMAVLQTTVANRRTANSTRLPSERSFGHGVKQSNPTTDADECKGFLQERTILGAFAPADRCVRFTTAPRCAGGSTRHHGATGWDSPSGSGSSPEMQRPAERRRPNCSLPQASIRSAARRLDPCGRPAGPGRGRRRRRPCRRCRRTPGPKSARPRCPSGRTG